VLTPTGTVEADKPADGHAIESGSNQMFERGQIYKSALTVVGILLLSFIWLNILGSLAMAMTLTSPAFENGGQIPSTYTCEGDDISPPLTWDGVPEGTKSLVLIIDDPDAPDPEAPKMVWVHWVVYNIPPDTQSLPENVSRAGLAPGIALGMNDFKKTGYGGPCPPVGRHRYFHKLYALNTKLNLEKATKAEVEEAMEGHVIASTELIGTYQKNDK